MRPNENIKKEFEPRCEKTGLRGFLTRSETNQAVPLQKVARGLKFRIKKVKGLRKQRR